MDWLRWYHGSVSDPKFTVVARRCGQSKSLVLAVWAAALEHGSQHDDRGSLAGLDPEVVAAALDEEPDAVASVLRALTDRGMIADGRIANWDKRQPKREDATNADRQKAWRERQREQRRREREAAWTDPPGNGLAEDFAEEDEGAGPFPDTEIHTEIHDVTPHNAPVTHRNAPVTPRTEQSITEKSPPPAPPVTGGGRGGGKSHSKPKRLPADWRPSAATMAWAASSRPDVDPDGALADMRGWANRVGAVEEDWDGRFRRWLDRAKTTPGYRPAAAAPAGGKWIGRMQQFRNHGRWLDDWGPRPDEPNCLVPAEFLGEMTT